MNEQEEMIEFLESVEHLGIYIVDRKTMEVYYENATARRYTVKDRIGQPCYLVHGNKSMCASCPLRNKDRVSYVNREDHGMVFSVKAKNITWKGIASYMILVDKEREIPKRKSLSEESMERMNRAPHSSIRSYVDINMSNMKCQAMHFAENGKHKIYNMPYDQYVSEVCFTEYVREEDRRRGMQILGSDNLRKLSEDSDGPSETRVSIRVSEEYLWRRGC